MPDRTTLPSPAPREGMALLQRAHEEWDALGRMSYHGVGGNGKDFGSTLWRADLDQADVEEIRDLVKELAEALGNAWHDEGYLKATLELEKEWGRGQADLLTECATACEAAEARVDRLTTALTVIAGTPASADDDGIKCRALARAALAVAAEEVNEPRGEDRVQVPNGVEVTGDARGVTGGSLTSPAEETTQ